jgi:transcriptional regulator with XRE-family HTH domain
MRVEDGHLDVLPLPAGGRLARGLVGIRKQFGVSQQELAEAAGVSPSAISQAESGARGLSLDTVVGLADRLDISVDRLLSTGPARTYRLARHDRARRVPNSPVTALAPDAATGLRVYLLDLPGGARSDPPFVHRGVSAIAPLRGLVQVELDDDRPVLRAGDVLVVEAGTVHGWRNLRANSASCYWILRD